MIGRASACVVAVATLSIASPAAAHDGPPFPIVTDRAVGPYVVSVWTDPDTTDDGSAGGQFWVMIAGDDGSSGVPPSTRARVTAAPLTGEGAPHAAAAEPVDGQAGTHFAVLVLDREARFRVRVELEGPLGRAAIDSEVEATYDRRPPPAMLALYLVPFLLVGALWTKFLVRRRQSARAAQASGPRATPGSA